MHQFARPRRIDQSEFRATMGRFASGLTVVASLDEDGDPAGLTCQSFSSLSVDPQLVLVCVGTGSTSWSRVERTGRFSVSILAEDQQDVCVALGRPVPTKFDGVGWHATDHGTVRVDGALAAVDCRIDAVHRAGDHLVVVGEVLDLAVREDGSPLLYFRGGYTRAMC
ncbi:MAG: flavin reductase family protein [Umezawaea sp.]